MMMDEVDHDGGGDLEFNEFLDMIDPLAREKPPDERDALELELRPHNEAFWGWMCKPRHELWSIRLAHLALFVCAHYTGLISLLHFWCHAPSLATM